MSPLSTLTNSALTDSTCSHLDGDVMLERINPDVSRIYRGDDTLGYAVSRIKNGRVKWDAVEDATQSDILDFRFNSRIDAAKAFLNR